MDIERISKMSIPWTRIGLALSILFASGCGNPVAHIPEFKANSVAVKPVHTPSTESPYRMLPYDQINVQFPYHPEQNPKANLSIRPDGNITLEEIGSIQAVGLTPDELAKKISEKSSDRLKNPEVVVAVVQYAPKKVFVGGEVRNPGVVLIQEGMTPLQAIFERGGFTRTAQMDSVILIRDGTSKNPKIGRINVNQAMEDGVPEQVTLLANDVLYIPMTGAGRSVLWVKQHIKDLIPWQLLRPPSIGAFIN